MTTIAIIGSGHVGSNLAKAAIFHGYDAVLSNSQGPDSLAGLVKGQPAFVARQNVAELEANVASAKRPS